MFSEKPPTWHPYAQDPQIVIYGAWSHFCRDGRFPRDLCTFHPYGVPGPLREHIKNRLWLGNGALSRSAASLLPSLRLCTPIFGQFYLLSNPARRHAHTNSHTDGIQPRCQGCRCLPTAPQAVAPDLRQDVPCHGHALLRHAVRGTRRKLRKDKHFQQNR